MKFLSRQYYSPVNSEIILLGAILVLSNLADIIHSSSRVYLFQQAQCLIYYKTFNPSKIKIDHHVDESLCKVRQVQSRLSIVDGLDSFLVFIPPLLVLATYKELLLRIGLRRLVLLNLCCSGFGVFYSSLIFWINRDWATPAALLSFAFDLVGGGSIVRITIVAKCIADIAPPKMLTNSYNYISGFYFLASAGGSSIGSLLLSNRVYLLNGLSVTCYAMTACVALTVPNHCGLEVQIHENNITITPEPDGSEPDGKDDDNPQSLSPAEFPAPSKVGVKPSLLRIFLNSWYTSFFSLLNLFNVPAHLLIILLVYLINGLATRTEVLLPQYMSLLLSWPFATVNMVMALKALVSALTLFALPTLRKLYLEPRMNTQQIDLFITQASLVANTIGVIGMGTSAPVGFFVLSLCVYTSGTGLADSLTAYGAMTLPPGEELSEFYMRTGLISTITALAGAPLWSAIFSIVVKSDALPLGLPFWLCATLFATAIMGVTALKRW